MAELTAEAPSGIYYTGYSNTQKLQEEGTSLTLRLNTVTQLLDKNEDDLKTTMPSRHLAVDVSIGLAFISKCGIQAKQLRLHQQPKKFELCTYVF